ncbi:helix-turn-helix domain-containing protein [Streptomyces sp. NPDC051940]|uniref:helix-turn-helix domain-containing protein n=1 Tax=Streptomyces sp. NPDC051940 TaxID=3155675 RepID=UPI003431FF2F
MKIRTDIAALLHQGLSDRAIATRLGCARPTAARTRRALGLPPVPLGVPPRTPTVEDAFRLHTEDAGDGHMRWTSYSCRGTPVLHYRGRQYTARRIAYRIRTGHAPEGQVTAGCDMPGCVAPAHVEDRRDRAVYAAIFGGD